MDEELMRILDKLDAWQPDEHDLQAAAREYDEYVAYGISCFEFMLMLEAS